MVVTTDVGDATDIHPTQKAPVGHRLALAARALAYGDSIIYSGPLFKDVVFRGDRATVSFTSVGTGLVSGDGEPLRGFEMAGNDGTYYPAVAKIKNHAILLHSESVSSPSAVRYGWSHVPDVNLFNRSGLPATPFTSSSRHPKHY